MAWVTVRNPLFEDVDGQKERQIADHDRAARELAVVVEDPTQAPSLGLGRCADFVYRARVERVLGKLPADLNGSTVLVICGGLGNYGVRDLLERGARVVLTDLSPEVIAKAREKWSRFPNIECRTADAEQLPFDDSSFDYAYCHDGLHHLPRPAIGIYEMFRVARRQVVFAEAQDSPAVRLLVRVGAAADWEESGNYVYRFTRREIHKLCSSLGAHAYEVDTFFNQYSDVLNQRLYPLLDNPIGFGAFRSAYRAFNAALGRFGNACVVSILKSAAR